LRFSRGSVVVPVRDVHGVLRGLQFIDAQGAKRFLTGTAKRGGFHLIGEVADAARLLVVEGYATGATLHQALGHPVAVAFDAGNLAPVCEALREAYPTIPITVCGDNDHTTKGNPGRTKALAAARSVAGSAAFPSFTKEISN